MRHYPLIVLAFLLFFVACDKKGGEKIEQVGSHTITTLEFEDYYSAYIEKMARFANAEKSTLYSMMCNPEEIPDNPLIHDIIEKMHPENNYEDYRQMRIIYEVAKKEGFVDRPVIKQIVDQVVLETVVRLYLQEEMSGRVNITEEQIEEQCAALRRQFPDRVGPLPIDQCLMIAEGSLRQDLQMREEMRMRDEIRESVSVSRNQDFNRLAYLTNLELYKSIRKEGGCEPGVRTPTPDANMTPMGGGAGVLPGGGAPMLPGN